MNRTTIRRAGVIHEAKRPDFHGDLRYRHPAGVIVNQALKAQQAPLKVIELLKTDVAGMEGKEIIVELVEFAIIGVFP